MHIIDGFVASVQSIMSHKMRSFLTLIGIMIGVMAVVTMFSSVSGFKKQIKTNMENMGWDHSLIIVASSGSNSNERRMGMMHSDSFLKTKQKITPLNVSDYTYLKEHVDALHIYGIIEDRKILRGSSPEERVQLRGTNTDFFKAKTYSISSGRLFNTLEEQQILPVAVVGYLFAQKHFASKDPLGKWITIGRNRYQIIGVLGKDKLNSGSGMNFNNFERENDLKAVYIPLTTAAKDLRSSNSIDYIYIQSKDEASFYNLENKARQALLTKNHMIRNFNFQDIGAMLLKVSQEMDDMMKKWNITLFAIASISLIVGGIGLFSTLLISINERMMEIGVRKSIGATEADIFFYFVIEAITLAIQGAVMGLGFAWVVLKGFSMAVKFSMPIPISGVLIGVGFAVVVGVISGLYPAIRASKINPIQAIFYFE